jgi:hypothetical protein
VWILNCFSGCSGLAAASSNLRNRQAGIYESR